MAETNSYGSVCLLGIMDQLWFHHAILYLDPGIPKFIPSSLTLEPSPPHPEEEPNSMSHTPVVTEMVAILLRKNIGKSKGEINNDDEEEEKRPTRGTPSVLTPEKRRQRRSFSSSPITHARQRKCLGGEPSKRMLKSKSSKSLEDLEMEEVRGFMNLGFIFKRELLSPRIISVVPGLQRLAVYSKKHTQQVQQEEKIEEKEEHSNAIPEEEEVRCTSPHDRPYLSEAWLIRRPDSPLLNLRVPMASPTAEIKQHLRCWAKTVAYVVEQDS